MIFFLLIGFIVFFFMFLFCKILKSYIPLYIFFFIFLFGIVAIQFKPIPIGVRHIFHLIIQPDDLYKPLITDNFKFYKKNYTKTYNLDPKYFDFYEIDFRANKNVIPRTYKFQGRLLVEFFHRDEILLKTYVSSMESVFYSDSSMKFYKAVSLYKFELPFQGKYKKDIKVKITVEKPDYEIEKFNDSIMLYISVSSSP